MWCDYQTKHLVPCVKYSNSSQDLFSVGGGLISIAAYVGGGYKKEFKYSEYLADLTRKQVFMQFLRLFDEAVKFVCSL